MALAARLATETDLPALAALMRRAIAENLKPFLTPAQIAASYAIMGLDTALIADRTYFVVEADGRIAGCGGWSRRATMYGGEPAPPRTRRSAARSGPRTRHGSAPCTRTRTGCGAASAA